GKFGLGDRSGWLLRVPQGRQGVRERHGVGSRREPIGRQDEKLAIDIGSQPLEGDQLTTEFFETIVIESEAELDTAIGDAPLGNKAPDDLLQDLLKIHASAPFAATFVLAPGRSLSRLKLRNPQQSSSRPKSHLRWINLSRYGRVVKCERPESAQGPRQPHRSRRPAIHPIEPIPAGLANGKFGAL